MVVGANCVAGGFGGWVAVVLDEGAGQGEIGVEGVWGKWGEVVVQGRSLGIGGQEKFSICGIICNHAILYLGITIGH